MGSHNDVASFVLRFKQCTRADERGEVAIEWRGHIRHVQADHEMCFTDLESAVTFIQNVLEPASAQSSAPTSEPQIDDVQTGEAPARMESGTRQATPDKFGGHKAALDKLAALRAQVSLLEAQLSGAQETGALQQPSAV